MSEEERREKRKSPRIVSIIALVIGIHMFLSGLLLVPITWWCTVIIPIRREGDVIGMLLYVVAFWPILCVMYLWPIAAIGLVLSIVALFIERNKYLRLLPLAFFIVGIYFYAMFFAVGYIYG